MGGGATGAGGSAAATGGDAAGGAEAAGASSGVLCTGLRGAGDGGGEVSLAGEAAAGGCGAGGEPGGWAACSDALACPATAGRGGGGGGSVPAPNSAGEALGEDGSASGAASAVCWAFVRSATRAAVSFCIASLSGGVGRAGTVERLGYGAFALGGAGRSSAIRPPSRLCHQSTGFSDVLPELHAASSDTAGTARTLPRRSNRAA